MSYKPIYSRAFLEKVFDWTSNLKNMAFQAANHACIDPDLNDYKRTYLTPYRQKHPTSNHQYTLYFKVISSDEVFFAWINDQTCLHDTHNKLTDPCLKEFQRLQNKGEIEIYDSQYHQIVFEVHPDKSKPIKCRSRFLGSEINLVSHTCDNIDFIGHAFHCDEENHEIAILHAKEFLEKLYLELSAVKISFKFQFIKVGHQDEVALLSQSFNPNQWEIISDIEDFILRKK